MINVRFRGTGLTEIVAGLMRVSARMRAMRIARWRASFRSRFQLSHHATEVDHYACDKWGSSSKVAPYLRSVNVLV